MTSFWNRYLTIVGGVGTFFTIMCGLLVAIEGMTVGMACVFTVAGMVITAFGVWAWGEPVRRQTAAPQPQRDVSHWLDDPGLHVWIQGLLEGGQRLKIQKDYHPSHYLKLSQECSSAMFQLYQEATEKFRTGEIIGNPMHPNVREAIANGIVDWVAAALRAIAEAYPGAAAEKRQLVQRLYCAAWRHLTDGNVIGEARTILAEPCRYAAEAVNRWVDHENLRR